jgi:transcriptional regulator with XRE-family HTH domain
MLDIVTIKDVKMSLGKTCKQMRKSNQLSREQLAEALSMSRATIQNIENGKNATLDNVLKVANHFGLLRNILSKITEINNASNKTSLY